MPFDFFSAGSVRILTPFHCRAHTLWTSQWAKNTPRPAFDADRGNPPKPRDMIYCSNRSTFCGKALACVSMATPACCNTCARASLAVSAA